MKDGLWDVYNDIHMGECGEICADKYALTREQQASVTNLHCQRVVMKYRRMIMQFRVMNERST